MQSIQNTYSRKRIIFFGCCFLMIVFWPLQAAGRCLSHRSTCKTSKQCCSGFCKRKRCVGSCRQDGFPCRSRKECCSRACVQGKCGGTCSARRTRCKRNEDCCSLRCFRSRCANKIKMLSACDPGLCQKLNPLTGKCITTCSSKKICQMGQCIKRKKLWTRTRPPKNRLIRRKPPKRRPLKRKPPKRIKPKITCKRSRCMQYSKAKKKCVYTCKKGEHCKKGKCQKRFRCNRMECLRFHPKVKRCLFVCDRHSYCDGKGRCIRPQPKKPKCPAELCMKAGAGGGCIYLCTPRQICERGRCIQYVR